MIFFVFLGGIVFFGFVAIVWGSHIDHAERLYELERKRERDKLDL